MTSIELIKRPIQKEFAIFQERFKEAFESNNELLSAVHSHILNKTGKQIRPLLTLLSAKSVGEINDDTIRCAVSLEMLHTASLIHDDVVDESMERRGQASVNSRWNNKVSVLVGDYLLSQSLSIATQTENLLVLKKITQLGKELSEGELLQMQNVKNINRDEQKYINVIKKKTATLFDTCTYSGAVSTHCTSEEAEILRKFGEIYGICFQIKDDIFDYVATEKEIGKPVGNDIKEGKITLPLLYALNANEKEREKYIEILSNKDFTKENIENLIHFSIDNGGIEYAEKRILDFKAEGDKILEKIKNIEIRESLGMMLEHTINRKS